VDGESRGNEDTSPNEFAQYEIKEGAGPGGGCSSRNAWQFQAKAKRHIVASIWQIAHLDNPMWGVAPVSVYTATTYGIPALRHDSCTI